MAHKYEVLSNDELALGVLDLLESSGHIRQIFDSEIGNKDEKVAALRASLPKISPDPKPSVRDQYQEDYDAQTTPTGLAMYTSAGYTMEKTITNISKGILGVCEDQKKWEKPLRNATKEYGRDEILQAFYDWAVGQGEFLGRSPITTFLKGVSSYVRPGRPSVTNPALERTEREIAAISDNLVIYTGEYRVRLAALINEFGQDFVVKAFGEFFPTVDEKSRPWAARDFLLKAPVMIATIQRRKQEAERQQQAVSAAYAAAQGSVEGDTEEEEL